MLLGVIIFGLYIVYLASDLPNVNEISNQRTLESTKIYARDGQTLLYEINGDAKRTSVPFSEIPEFVKNATISIEDSAFYNHPAFDWRGFLRAVFVNITRGSVQGGSTITQQLARTIFLTQERTIFRKLKELVLAVRLEEKYSKDEILGLYLNSVPYGGNAYGIETAAQNYFNKSTKDVTLNEAATLASLTKAPSYYSPWGSHLDELLQRKDLVLKRMYELGYIDSEEFERNTGLVPKIMVRSKSGIKAPHFVAYLQDYLSKKYGEDVIASGGLKITSSLDWELEQKAEQVVKDGATRNSELYNGRNAALVALDPKTGQVLAMVGSKDYFGKPEPENCIPGSTCFFEGNFNVASQGFRQPGSAFKPFAYLTAFQEGLTPDTIVWDAPTEFSASNPKCPLIPDYSNDDTNCYHPQNFDDIFRGPVTLKTGLAQSINVPSVKVLYVAGIENTIKNAESFGITTLKDRSRFGLSLVLGGGEVRLLELVRAYSVFANEGALSQINPIIKIEDSVGGVLEEYKDSLENVVDSKYPRLVNDILSDPSLRAPLFKNSLSLTLVPGHQVALKTGTTNNYIDAWALGYTRDLVVGVWAGNNNRKPLQKRGSSILAAVPIWHDFLATALQKYPTSTFTKPDPVFAENPVLRGELIKGEYHDLLYYLGRINDPQFNNWEEGVRYWLRSNSVDQDKFVFSSDSAPVSSSLGASQAIEISLLSPRNGSFVGDSVAVSVSIKSAIEITKIEIYLNNILLDSEVGSFGNSYSYNKILSLSEAHLQNSLVIRAEDASQNKILKEIILFKN